MPGALSGEKQPLGPHLHEGLYELVFMLRGEQIYQAEGRNYCLHSGQFFLTPPDLVHSTGGNFEDKALYYYLQADLRQLRRCLNGPLAREAELLAQARAPGHGRQPPGISPAKGGRAAA